MRSSRRPGAPPGPYVVAGLGRAGRAAIEALLARHPPGEVSVWGGEPTRRARRELAETPIAAVRVDLGGDGVELLDADPRPRSLIKSPGIPFDHPLIAAALERGLAVIDEAELGWRLDRRPMVAVTGTNGKSTVVALVAAVLRAAGREVLVGGNTLLDPPLSALIDRDGDLIVAEISSFQLEGSPELLPEAAILTNVAPHHLGRHRTLAEYARCKRRLFVRDERAVGLAVLNVDDPLGRRLAEEVRARNGTVAGFGTSEDAEYRILDCEWTLASSRVKIQSPSETVELKTRLPGRHNAHNVAAALALAGGLGISPEVAEAAIAETPAPPGRLELVHRAPPCDVLVDGALSPHGIRAVLAAARGATDRDRTGGVIAVVSGIDMVNDLAEQRAMGEAARELSDLLILTGQRWRPSAPAGPLPGLVEGARRSHGGELEVVPGRRAAIDRAMSRAQPGDVVLVLGRGARRSHLFDDRDQPRRFDDRDEVRAALGAQWIVEE